MIARLLISTDINIRSREIDKILASHIGSGKPNHPDLLIIKAGEKLGIAEARKIKAHFSLKPYSAKGRVVVVEEAGSMTIEAQNALLKTIEELPEDGILILGASSDSNILPTILSRCKITNFQSENSGNETSNNKYFQDLKKLVSSTTAERFEYVEKLKEKDDFLRTLVSFWHKESNIAKPEAAKFLKELLKAEEWAKQNVNIRTILEYLMLVMPRDI